MRSCRCGRGGGRSGAMARPIRSIEIYLPLDFNDGRPIPESQYVALQQELLNRFHGPATANVLARLTAVVQDGRVGAACIFESVGQDGETVESTLGVNRLGNLDDGAVIPGQERRIDASRPEGVSKHVS